MELSYTISDADIREAFRLRFWNLPRKLFIGFLFLFTLGDILLIGTDLKNGLSDGYRVTEILSLDSTSILLVGLFVACFFLALVFIYYPWHVVHKFRKFPDSDGVISATVTPEYLEVRVSTCGSSHFNWPVYKHWREGKKIILLQLRNGHSQMLPKAFLSAAELDQLREILTSALPRKS